jgi:hypothetical protein
LLSNDDIIIVAVSANPFKRGIDYWFSHLDDFKKLSHIALLQNATTEKIKAIGSAPEFVEEARKSIASDIIKRQLPVAIERDEKITIEYERFKQTYDNTKEDLKKAKERVARAKRSLREFIINLFTDLILQVKGCDMETIADFFERNIGDGGIVLNTKIQNEFERQIEGAYSEINQMQISLETDLNQYNSVIGQMAHDGIKEGGKFLLKGGVHITADGIKAARNFLMPFLKFKPWGQSNLPVFLIRLYLSLEAVSELLWICGILLIRNSKKINSRSR